MAIVLLLPFHLVLRRGRRGVERAAPPRRQAGGSAGGGDQNGAHIGIHFAPEQRLVERLHQVGRIVGQVPQIGEVYGDAGGDAVGGYSVGDIGPRQRRGRVHGLKFGSHRGRRHIRDDIKRREVAEHAGGRQRRLAHSRGLRRQAGGGGDGGVERAQQAGGGEDRLPHASPRSAK